MYSIKKTDSRKGTGGYRLDADPEDCLLWEGNLNSSGYGRIWVFYAELGLKQRYVHRVAWEAAFGTIPRGLEIDHLCCNTTCYYLPHLEVVTREENKRRADARVTHCPKGHPYSEENTYYSGGNRACKICHRRNSARYSRSKSSPVPQGLRRTDKWVDVLELASQGYSISRISHLTGVTRSAIRDNLPEYRKNQVGRPSHTKEKK